MRAFDVATDEPLMASVAGRYASALFDLASEQNKVAEVEGDLGKFQSLCSESAEMLGMVRSPVIPADEQSQALTAILGKAGAGALTINFFKLLAKNRRLFAASDMAKAFQSLAAKSRGQVTAEVTSASALTDAHTAQLRETLKASVGKDVTLQTKVDPAILGGLIVKLASRMIDSSLKTKLDTMKVVLKGGN
jgi:F-type H+-transporting ATPase subunit delta